MILGQYLPFRSKNILKHRERIIGLDGSVICPSHAQSEVRLVFTGSADAFFHESDHVLFVIDPVPFALGIFGPLVARPLHGLMMAGGNDDSVVIGKLLVSWVICEEDSAGLRDEARPHCRPDKVGLESDKQVEYMLVELGVESEVADVVLSSPPAGERGGFVVNEEASVLYAWFAVGCDLVEGVYLLMLSCGDISPPM